MAQRRILGVLLFFSPILLSMALQMVYQGENVQALYEGNERLVLAITVGLAVIGLAVSIDAATAEARQADGLTSGGILGAVLGSTVAWVVGGVLLAIAVELAIRFGVTDRTNWWSASVIGWFEQVGAHRLACGFVGLSVGWRFRYTYPKDSDTIGWAGAAIGAIVGLGAASFFQADHTYLAWGPLALNGTYVAAAAVGGSIAALTALFQPGHDWRERVEMERRKTEEREQAERYHAAVGHLASAGYEIRANSLANTLVSGYLNWTMIGQSEEEKAEARERLQTFADTDGKPMVDLWKMVSSGSMGGRPTPPFVVYDASGEEIRRFDSVVALESFASGLALAAPGSAPPTALPPASATARRARRLRKR